MIRKELLEFRKAVSQMMKMKTKGILCVAAAMLAMAGAAKSAAKGSCISKAKALAGSQNVSGR